MKTLHIALLTATGVLLSLSLLRTGSPETPRDCRPVKQGLLDRDALGLPEPLLERQMGGRLA